MTFKSIALASAAAIALAGATLAAVEMTLAQADRPADSAPSAYQDTMPTNPGALPDPTAGGGAPLAVVDDPAETLANAKVESTNGQPIGDVEDVVLAQDGTPDRINVEVGGFLGIGSKIVAIDADDLTYNRDRKTVVTRLSPEDIKALPSAEPKG